MDNFVMIERIFYFVFGIVLPYAAEQFAYSRFIPNGNQQNVDNAPTVTQGYGWRLVWDTAYFLLFISAGYRIIMSTAPFSAFERLGYFLFLAGVAIRIWSLREIGRFYDPGIAVKSDHQMVHTGPYRVLRHPLHIGTVLQITGLSFFAPVWLAFPAVLASLSLSLYLNYIEDRTHAKKLGAAFKSYYSETWDIVDLIFWKSKMGE